MSKAPGGHVIESYLNDDLRSHRKPLRVGLAPPAAWAAGCGAGKAGRFDDRLE
jgi:hypothetical protein